jgi:hypothetical protein
VLLLAWYSAANVAKEQLLANFLSHFQLTAEEQSALKHQQFDRGMYINHGIALQHVVRTIVGLIV